MGLIVIAFNLNQEYIAAELCENKDKPELGCEGHCYLEKQIEKAEQVGVIPNNSKSEGKVVYEIWPAISQAEFVFTFQKYSYQLAHIWWQFDYSTVSFSNRLEIPPPECA